MLYGCHKGHEAIIWHAEESKLMQVAQDEDNQSNAIDKADVLFIEYTDCAYV